MPTTFKPTSWWNHSTKTETLEKQCHLLRRQLRLLAKYSPHYKERFNSAEIDVQKIKTLEDFSQLPFTSKRDLASPRDFIIQPSTEELKKSPAVVLRSLLKGVKSTRNELVHEFRPIQMTSTTGRSSEPVPFTYTHRDLEVLNESGRRLLQLAGINSSYKTVNTFPFAPHLAFWQAHQASVAANMFIVSSGGGKTMGTHGNCNLITKIKPEVIVAMPTFLYHLLQHAKENGLRWPHLKTVLLGGEKVPEGMRRKLRSLASDIGAPELDVVSTYGMTEAKLAWSECVTPSGNTPSGYHLYPDLVYVEIIDPVTGDVLPEKTAGEIVITPLESRGTSVLRYRTGDLISGGLTYDICPHCGLSTPRLEGKISRVSDINRLHLDKLKGTLVDFNQLEHILDDIEGLGTWQIELRKKNDDPLGTDELRVHSSPLNSSYNKSQLATDIKRRLREETELCPNEIIFHDEDTMRQLQGVGVELKEKKVLDNRPQ